MTRQLDASYHDWVDEQRRADAPVTPAATVVILRDHADDLEVLMLRRGADAAFAGGLWVCPGAALSRHRAREIQLAPPTFVTLTYLSRSRRVADALDAFGAREPRFYETHVVRTDTSMTFLWSPDVAYDSGDLAVPGPRHRILTDSSGWHLDDTGCPW